MGGSVNVFCYLIDEGALIQDYFLKDIEAGIAGEFQKYQRMALDNFAKMREKAV